MLQPFVENAVVHGFENVESPGYLTISGRKKGNRNRQAIPNREIESCVGKGTTVILEFPCEIGGVKDVIIAFGCRG